MERRLVVVGCGLVGSAIVREALVEVDRFSEIIVLSRSIPEEFIDDDRLSAGIGDVGSGDLDTVLRDGDILVLAAGSPDPRCAPANVNRLLGPSALALTETIQTAAARKDLHIILVSSGGAVYGVRDEPVAESQAIDPSSVYGAVKASEECMLRPLQGLNGTQVTVVRASTVYGRRRIGFAGQGLVQLAIDRVRSGDEITLFGQGLDRRGYLLDEDFGRLVVELATSEDLRFDTFNLCSGEVFTGAEVVKVVGQVLGQDPIIELQSGINHHIVLDTSRLKAQLPNFSFTPFRTGVEGLIEAA